MKTTNYAHDPISALEHATWEHWDHQESWKNLITRWEGIAGVSLDWLCEVRWQNSGETTTQDGHKLYFSGKEDRHENGVGFLVHKDTVNTVMGCQPISSRLITVRLRATPFNITIVQAYAPTTDYDDEKIEGFYEQLQ